MTHKESDEVKKLAREIVKANTGEAIKIFLAGVILQLLEASEAIADAAKAVLVDKGLRGDDSAPKLVTVFVVPVEEAVNWEIYKSSLGQALIDSAEGKAYEELGQPPDGFYYAAEEPYLDQGDSNEGQVWKMEVYLEADSYVDQTPPEELGGEA